MPRKGEHMSEEQRLRIKEANIGKHNQKHTEQAKQRISLALKGRSHSAEHNAKVSAALTGHKRLPFSEEWKEHMADGVRRSYAEGHRSRICTLEHRKHLSEARRESGVAKGANNPNWKGGLTVLGVRLRNSDRYKNWRAQVYERDNYICQECGIVGTGDNLQAHHKIPLSIILEEQKIKTLAQAIECEAIWDAANGITLCDNCHLETDTYGWRIWNGYLRQKGGVMA